MFPSCGEPRLIAGRYNERVDVWTLTNTLIIVKVYSICRARWSLVLLHRRLALPPTCTWNGARRLRQSKHKTQSAVRFFLLTYVFSIAVHFLKCALCLSGWLWCRVHAILRIFEMLLKNTSRSMKPLLKWFSNATVIPTTYWYSWTDHASGCDHWPRDIQSIIH